WAGPIPNENGTAPGWWVDRPDGRVIVALPGPPREMGPMWSGWVLPRLEARGLGRSMASVTLRLTGIGESAIADRLGDLLTGARPQVATYARPDAVDIRIWTHADAGNEGGAHAPRDDPAALVAATEARIVELLGEHVWARGMTTWPDALREALDAHG